MKKIFLPLGLFALIVAPSAGSAKLVLDIPPILAGANSCAQYGCPKGASCYPECLTDQCNSACCNDCNPCDPTCKRPCSTCSSCCGTTCMDSNTSCTNCCNSSCSTEACPSGPTGRLNDTGISWSGGTATGNGTTCTDANQDCNYGWDKNDGADATNGHAGFKFTKLDSSGNVTTGTSFECVRDERTGLTWEVISLATADKNWATAKTAATSFNACGKSSGWRLPTVKELLSIVSYYDVVQSPAVPAIDTDYFQNTASTGYWTSTEVADNDAIEEAWIVNFSTAMTAQQDASVSNKNVRLVHD